MQRAIWTHGFEQQVHNTIEETHVRCYECQDGLLHEHDKRPQEVDIDNRVEGQLVLVGLRMVFDVARLLS